MLAQSWGATSDNRVDWYEERFIEIFQYMIAEIGKILSRRQSRWFVSGCIIAIQKPNFLNYQVMLNSVHV